jgi:hypothetical protein
LIIQAMAKMIAATMASMPILLPLPRRGIRLPRRDNRAPSEA